MIVSSQPCLLMTGNPVTSISLPHLVYWAVYSFGIVPSYLGKQITTNNECDFN